MKIVAANWVGENTSTVGTGPLALSGAISTFCPFSVLPDGSEVYYTLQEGFNRETGIGVVSNGTLTRKVQATLVAGVYTETDIPISLSGNGQVFAVINADFMTRIYNFSLDVADSVAAAAASAQSSADSAALANDHEQQSAQNAEDASLYAQSASDSKIAADASKNAAASSAAAAASSQADALASKNASVASETNSKSSENASSQYATNAYNSAAAALASRNAAKTSEDNALASKTAAGQSALAAKDSENKAKTSETNAKTSETNAKTSETNAKASETASNSANTAAQTAKDQTQSLYNQTVDLVAGVQAPDKLPTSPGGSRAWMKIANVKNAGQSNCFAQFIIGGGDNFGSANLPIDIFSISGRGLPYTLTSNNIDANFTQRALIPASNSTSRLKLGVVKNTDGSFDVYLLSPNGYFPVMWLNRLNVQSKNGLITGPIIDRTGYSWITTEPAGIVYNSPSDYLLANDSTIPRTNVANTFSQPQVISSTLTLGADATSAMHAVTKQQLDKEISDRSRFQQYPNDTRVVDPSGSRYLFVVNRDSYDDWGVYDVINNAKIPLPGSSGGTGSITYSGGWINLLNGRGVETARSDLGLGSLATLSTVSKKQLDYDLNRGTMFAGGRTNSQGAGVWTYDNTSFGWGEQFATCIQVSNRGDSGAGAGNGIWQHYLALCTSGNLLYAINIHGKYESYRIWSSRNTTVDGSGFIKQASPIVRVVTDVDSMTPNFLEGFTLSGSGSVNDEAEGAVVSKIGTGKYSISGTTGLYPDGWHIEVPKDVNGNRLCFVEVSFVDGLILINSFKPKLDLETGGIKAGDAIDIPIGRWVDVRVGMPDDSIYNQNRRD